MSVLLRPRAPWLLVLLAVLPACGGGAAEGRPNLVLIVVDTLRSDAILDPQGRVNTPNIDALAADGIGFPNTFAHAPMTLPSHTALFSSRLPFQTGVVNNGQKVPEEFPLLAGWLEDFGYESRAVLSLGTLVPWGDRLPGIKRGFREYDTRFWNLASADSVARRTRESLDDRRTGRPLFLFAHFCDPHEPYDSHRDDVHFVEIRLDGEPYETVPSSNMSMLERPITLPVGDHTVEFRSADPFRVRALALMKDHDRLGVEWQEGAIIEELTYGRAVLNVPEGQAGELTLRIWVNDVPPHEELVARYIREVEYADRYVGEVIAELKARGLYDDSLIVFTSDHGEALGEHGRVGHVEALTDDMIKVPLIIKPPVGHPRAAELAAVSGSLVRHVDLVPTLLELLGVPRMEGVSGGSLLGDRGNVVHFAETHMPEAKANKVGLRDERFKMIYLIDEDRFVLYDLQADPAEDHDVFAERQSERPAWAERLRGFAAIAMDKTRKPGETDDALQEELDALGY